jgi:hypothetical protein
MTKKRQTKSLEQINRVKPYYLQKKEDETESTRMPTGNWSSAP